MIHKLINFFTNRRNLNQWKPSEEEQVSLQQKFSIKKFNDILVSLNISSATPVYFQSRISNSTISLTDSLEILDCLKNLTTPKGCLLVPAFHYQGSLLSTLGSVKNFNLNTLYTTTGAIPEFFRRSANVCRSEHPINSFCAYGKMGEELIRNHAKSKYLYDEHNPISKISLLDDAICISINAPFSSYHPIHRTSSLLLDNHKFYLHKKINANYTLENKNKSMAFYIPNEFSAYLIDMNKQIHQLNNFYEKYFLPGGFIYVYKIKKIEDHYLQNFKTENALSQFKRRRIPLASFLGNHFYIKKHFDSIDNILHPK
ncbi:MAG: hypothetical protein COA79_17140 [Planctomycetota bacterium]|nr:MAG: hypothetical protein COA79_17140 [Planctomycetota bacterium]